MAPPDPAGLIEAQIEQWRTYLRRRQAIHSVDVAELEDHLREQVAGLVESGLAVDEAFLVAVKRMGALDALSREFAVEHSERLWKQLVVVPEDSGAPRSAVELFIYYVLIALGGGVLTGFTLMVFEAIGINAEPFVQRWLLPCGAAGAVVVALWAIAARISEFGFSPNRVAALGENLILLVNLSWSAVLSIRFLRGRASFSALERWQTDYLPVYAVWAAIVVIVLPPLFGYR